MAGAGVRGHADPVFLLMHAGVHGHRDAPSLPATPIPTLRTGVQGWTPLPTPQCMQEEAKQLLKANTLEARFLRALQLERQHTTRHFLLPPLPPKDPRPPSLSLCAKPLPWGGVGGGDDTLGYECSSKPSALRWTCMGFAAQGFAAGGVAD